MMTRITKVSEIPSATSTSWIEEEINSASSEPTMIFMPAGRLGSRA